jgi:hypothetical protein
MPKSRCQINPGRADIDGNDICEVGSQPVRGGVEAGMAKGARLDGDKTIGELLKDI